MVVGVSTCRAFMQYHSGVLHDKECDEQAPGHAVTMAGYGEEDGKKYWNIKNSWSESWGNKGYIRITRSDEVGAGSA